MLNNWLLFLMFFVFPHAGDVEGAEGTPGDDAPEGDADAAGDDDDAGSDDTDTDDETHAGGVDDDGDGDESSAPARGKTARRDTSADDAREALRMARESRETLERMRPTQADPVFADEERRLADANTSELEKWQINANRTLRETQQRSQRAEFQAQDMYDKATYQAKSVANPLYAKYADKVEKQLAEARSKGANPPREFVLDLVLGRAMREGNFKPASKAAAKTTIPRGKSPGARSDTPARGGTSDHQKRTARLANINI